MNAKPKITESKRFGHTNGSLRGNMFRIGNTWFLVFSCFRENGYYYYKISNQTDPNKWSIMSAEKLCALEVDEVKMYVFDWNKVRIQDTDNIEKVYELKGSENA